MNINKTTVVVLQTSEPKNFPLDLLLYITESHFFFFLLKLLSSLLFLFFFYQVGNQIAPAISEVKILSFT